MTLDFYKFKRTELAVKVAYAENDKDDLRIKLNETINQKNKLHEHLLNIQDELDKVRDTNI
jgi:hypothetical protein